MKNNLEIYPGNQPPSHDNHVSVVVKATNGEFIGGMDGPLYGKRSWRWWKDVIMWQELLPESD